MTMSANSISRRNLVVGTMGAVAAAALPVGAKARSSDPWVSAKLDAMSQATENIHIMEVQSNSFAPYYRRGDLIFVKPEVAKVTDHVFLKRKAAASVFGVLVHRDAKAIYVRGFKAGDRLQSVPLSSISEWGRIIINWRV